MKQIRLKVNGEWKSVIAEPKRALLDLLREDLGLTGTKQSCDRNGQCGACTVIVNGKAVRSCLIMISDLNGAEVISIEGLGTPDNPHLIQEAFVLAGAIQCGFCTPGMIMAAKGLLDSNPNPTADEIKTALRHNLCRCTGYNKIVEAVKLAGRFLRGETTPSQIQPDPSLGLIGVSLPRPLSILKACGMAAFSADYLISGSLHLATVRSPYHNALIKSINTGAAEKMPGVAGVITAKDIKGTNFVGEMVKDQRIFCETYAPVLGAVVAATAAETLEQALAAAEAVTVEYEPLPFVLTPEEAMAEGAPRVHNEWPNVCYTQPQIKGDAKKALTGSAAVVEETFSTQLLHQAPLEPEACVAYLDGEGEDAQLVVIGRSINIHHHAEVLQEALGWDNIRYQEAFSGGQFGIKIDITSEALTAAAALHFKRPVRFIPGITESMWLTTKRHPFTMKTRLGVDAQGRVTALGMDFVVENGAYTSVGPVIIERSLIMLNSGYYIPAVNAFAKLVYTNNAWGGAARGAGPPQVNFALECAMDMLAEKLGVDPLEFRLTNALRPGQTNSCGEVMEEWTYAECLEALKPHYERAKKDAKAHNNGRMKRGVGLAGNSFGVSQQDRSLVALELDSDGGVTVYAAVADPGEGNDAMFTQLGGKLMDLPPHKVRFQTRDSELTTSTGPSAGSRITYVIGMALIDAVGQLKAAMAETGASTREALAAAGKPVRYMGRFVDSTTPLDRQTGQGKPSDSYIHGVQMAEVEVDTKTGEVKVLKMTAVVDAGMLINPLVVECQIEGGMDMGAGMALREIYVHGKTKDWVTLKYPTMKTAFDMEVVLIENPRKKGPLGATGVGEFTLVPTQPSIVNAICNATGARVFNLPATPDKVLAALAAQKAN